MVLCKNVFGVATELTHGELSLLRVAAEITHGMLSIFRGAAQMTHGVLSIFGDATEMTHGVFSILGGATVMTHGALPLFEGEAEMTHTVHCPYSKVQLSWPMVQCLRFVTKMTHENENGLTFLWCTLLTWGSNSDGSKHSARLVMEPVLLISPRCL